MVIDCLSKCKKAEREKLLQILKKERNKVTKSEVQFAIKLIKKYNSEKAALNYARQVVDEANKILNKINDDKLKEILNKSSDFIIDRRY